LCCNTFAISFPSIAIQSIYLRVIEGSRSRSNLQLWINLIETMVILRALA